MKLPTTLALFLTLSFGSLSPARAQCGQWDVVIGVPGIAGPGNPGVQCSALWDDGGGTKLYVGGGFASAGGVSASNIACWDGTSWSALGAGVDLTVEALAVFDDGTGSKLYVGGAFSQAGGNVAKALASWDGTQWAEVGGGTNSGAQVWSLTVTSVAGGPQLLYVGGNFSQLGGVNKLGVGAWNGTIWQALGTGIGSGVYDLEGWDPDGAGPAVSQLYATGGFNSAGGVSAAKVASWNGTSWSALGIGLTGGGVVGLELEPYDDGSGEQLCVGGQFINAGTANGVNNIARWNGSAWSGLGTGCSGYVDALERHDDGNGMQLYAGGGFGLAGGQPASRVARWNGSSWGPVGSGVTTPGSPEVRTLKSASDAHGPVLFAGGLWHSMDRLNAEHVALWRGTSIGVPYCTAKLTAGGCLPSMGSTGAPSLSNASGFVITATQVKPNANGLLFFSTLGPQGVPFQGGYLCVKSPFYRLLLQNSGGSGPCTGSLTNTLAQFAAQGAGGGFVVPGARVDCQAWFRDPQSPSTTGLSNGLQFIVCP